MKKSYIIIRHSLIIIASVLTSISVLSCENKIDIIPKSEILTLPSQTAHDFQSVLTDSGKIQLVMSSTLMEQYENADSKYSEFRNGIKILFYDGHKEPVASVTSKYAKYLQTDNIWELRDSVVVINEKNEMLETELLNWNQERDLIYTDRYVKITSEDQIIHGFGFESDSHLRKQKIKKVQATIYFNDEE
jgi:LPS export ABC transporter protein LptC